ncbi:hypothetical protein SO802_014346 [Lithocarpus litseifolius]|uniref:RNase H type-1 domain-containing protein n=1 Tax=Lithocarpus litseifolius TaxID=425828 RepID=A0AAW2CUS2_9ROSI
MESLTNHWRNLSLNDREGGKLTVKKGRAIQEYTMAAKFLRPRVLNTEAIARTFSPLWRSRNGFQVREVGDHTRLFVFDNAEEVDKILACEPWSFDRLLVVLHRPEFRPESAVSAVRRYRPKRPKWPNSARFSPILAESARVSAASARKKKNKWPTRPDAQAAASLARRRVAPHPTLRVKVHDIPVSYLKREIVEELCEAIGVVNRVSKDEEVDGGSFIRVRVRVDITTPLCRGRVLSIEDEECGCLDHTDRDCDKWIESDGTLGNSDKKYGPWIRASPLQARRKPVVVVSGFYEVRKKGSSHKETFNAPEISKLKSSVLLNGDINENKGDFIEKQIREIDKELNNFDISGSNSRGAATNQHEVYVDSLTFTNLSGGVGSGLEAGAGIRVVVRNAKGEVIAALADKISHPGSVEVLEALAVRRAAKFIVELGITGSVFKGDSEIVCRALRTANCRHLSIGQIVKDIMSIVGSLRTFSFSHIRWQDNRVAHALAKRAIVSFLLLVWMEHVPSDIQQAWIPTANLTPSTLSWISSLSLRSEPTVVVVVLRSRSHLQRTLIDKLLITIFTIDKVLLPKELFKAQAETQAPISTPKAAADSPKANTKKAPSLLDEANTPLADDENSKLPFSLPKNGDLSKLPLSLRCFALSRRADEIEGEPSGADEIEGELSGADEIEGELQTQNFWVCVLVIWVEFFVAGFDWEEQEEQMFL